jgi:hypothetical protein
MAMMQLSRWNHAITNTVTFTTAIGTSGGFGFHSYAGALLLIDSVNGSTSSATTATLTFYVRTTETDSSNYVVTDSGSAVTLDVSPGKAFPIPDAMFPGSYVQAVSSNGNVVCKVLLKG